MTDTREIPAAEQAKKKKKANPQAIKRKLMRKLIRLDSSFPLLPQVRRNG